MQAPAIDDHVSTKVYAWYTVVAEWMPPGQGFTGICLQCRESTLADTIDLGQWPHDVVHPLVEALAVAIADVQHSFCEESQATSESSAAVARRAVSEALSRHADDIADVLEQCLSERLQAYLTREVESADWELRRPAAS